MICLVMVSYAWGGDCPPARPPGLNPVYSSNPWESNHRDGHTGHNNYNKLVCITLIDFFYHFFTITTKQDIYLHSISISIIVSNIMIL